MKKKPSFNEFQGHRLDAKSLVDKNSSDGEICAKNLVCKKFGRGARSNFWSLKFLGIKVSLITFLN